MKIKLLGTRGSIPTPGKDTVKYGGNTTCIDLTLNNGEKIIIDAGSGMRVLSEEILSQKINHINLFLTHSHWDHIQGFPFFIPIYIPNFSIKIFAASPTYDRLLDILKGQMQSLYYPVPFKQIAANIEFEKIRKKESGPLRGKFFSLLSSFFGAGYLKHKKAISTTGESVYSEIMAKAVDKIVKIADYDILMIPHSRAVRQSPLDDLEICKKIKQLSLNPDRIRIIEDKLSSKILKGIIGKAEVALGSRFHFIVSSISQNVPTLAVSWSHKYKEMMRMFGLEEFTLNYDKLDENSLLAGIERLWKDRTKIRNQINFKLPEIKKLSKDNARIIVDFIKNYKKEKITINDVVKRHLCAGCGSCVSSCPVNAINMLENKIGELVPSINFEKCIFCGICVDVCPGYEVDFDKFANEMFDRDCKTSPFGAYRDLYLSRSKDKKFLIERSSGGTITDIIRSEMKNKNIDGCIVVSPGGNPFYPKATIVRNEKE
ncbi:MAG: 4Fe-4S binding protein, partial [candidate division WOR-3 bacterium]